MHGARHAVLERVWRAAVRARRSARAARDRRAHAADAADCRRVGEHRDHIARGWTCRGRRARRPLDDSAHHWSLAGAGKRRHEAVFAVPGHYLVCENIKLSLFKFIAVDGFFRY